MSRAPLAAGSAAVLALLLAACGSETPSVTVGPAAQQSVAEPEPTEAAPDPDPTETTPVEPDPEPEPTETTPAEPEPEPEPTTEGPEDPTETDDPPGGGSSTEGADDPSEGTEPSAPTGDVTELAIGETVAVSRSGEEPFGEITLLEIQRDFECDGREANSAEGRQVIGLRLSTEVTGDIGFIDVQSHTAQALNADGEPVFHRQAYGCSSEEIEQITDSGTSNEGWFVLVLGPSAESFTWDHGSSDDWVQVDLSDDGDS